MTTTPNAPRGVSAQFTGIQSVSRSNSSRLSRRAPGRPHLGHGAPAPNPKYFGFAYHMDFKASAFCVEYQCVNEVPTPKKIVEDILNEERSSGHPMRNRPTWALAAVVVVVCAAAVALGAQNDEPAAPRTTTRVTMKEGGLIGRYEITVTDPAGSLQQATFTCGAKNARTGYLFERGTFEACRTAIGEPETLEYLETGERPPADCGAVQQITHAGWRYVITGESFNGHTYLPVHQELTVKTACDEALWQQMKAMLPES